MKQLTEDEIFRIEEGYKSALSSHQCYFFSNPDFDRTDLHNILDKVIDHLILSEDYSFYREKEISDHPSDWTTTWNGREFIVGPVQTPCG